MLRPRCSRLEDIVRVILPAHWDPENRRISSGLFRGMNISVSRLAVLSLDELIPIFKTDFARADGGEPFVGIGEINVGRLEDIGQEYAAALWVEEDPTANNPAHAEVPGEIKRKPLARAIVAALKVHNLR